MIDVNFTHAVSLIDKLSLEDAGLVRLLVIDECSIEEIAETEGLSVLSVEERLKKIEIEVNRLISKNLMIH